MFLNSLPQIRHVRSRSFSFENQLAKPGQGGKARGGRKGSPFIRDFKPGETITLADIAGPGCIRHIFMTTGAIPTPDVEKTGGTEASLRGVVLRIWWDEEKNPSVECPLGDFFGLMQAQRSSYSSLMMVVNPDAGMNCYFPMPFASRARITVTNENPRLIDVLAYNIDYEEWDDIDPSVGRFHVQWRRENPTVPMRDYLVADISGKGHLVGVTLGITPLSSEWWGEGEPKFYIDDEEDFPTIVGNGTEDYFGFAWGFGPGHCGLYSGINLNDQFDGLKRISLYRWHILDPIYFSSRLRLTFQQIGFNRFTLFERSDDWCSSAYWYQVEPHKMFEPLPEAHHRAPRWSPRCIYNSEPNL